MNIAIEARAFSTKSSGIRSYVHNLVEQLKKHPEISIDIITGSSNSKTPLRAELFTPYWLSHQVTPYLTQTKPDLVHFTKAAVPNNLLIPSIVTIYDVIPLLLPETQSPLRRIYWPKTLKSATSNANHIITISQQSKKDIIEKLHVSADKITVIPLAIDTNHFKPTENKPTNNPYILFVGTWDARKNIKLLIDAFSSIADQIPHKLIIAGKPAHKDDGSRDHAASSSYASRIEFKENVPYSELPGLYANADLFIFPSAYEGWGFPPQEAMACGTPVIVSDGGSLPEVVSDAGIVVPFLEKEVHARMHDKDFTRRLAQEMLSVLTSPEKQQAMITKGLAQASRQTWQDVAEQTIAVYKQVV
jgi:glycosyltransferase involved in cell wall biosynthesis